MYAINHAATALLLKKKEDRVPILPLLISTQLIEVLWVVFNWLGIEHYSIDGGELHLNYLPWSHSVFSTVLLSMLAYGIVRWGFKKNRLAVLFAIGVISHLALDIIFHEKDIRLSPFSDAPAWGLGIIRYPIMNFILEFIYGLFCWWYYKGNRSLLITIIVFNVLDLPVMLAHGDALMLFQKHPALLPTFILFQILITWFFVWRYSASRVSLATRRETKQETQLSVR